MNNDQDANISETFQSDACNRNVNDDFRFSKYIKKKNIAKGIRNPKHPVAKQIIDPVKIFIKPFDIKPSSLTVNDDITKSSSFSHVLSSWNNVNHARSKFATDPMWRKYYCHKNFNQSVSSFSATDYFPKTVIPSLLASMFSNNTDESVEKSTSSLPSSHSGPHVTSSERATSYRRDHYDDNDDDDDDDNSTVTSKSENSNSSRASHFTSAHQSFFGNDDNDENVGQDNDHHDYFDDQHINDDDEGEDDPNDRRTPESEPRDSPLARSTPTKNTNTNTNTKLRYLKIKYHNRTPTLQEIRDTHRLQQKESESDLQSKKSKKSKLSKARKSVFKRKSIAASREDSIAFQNLPFHNMNTEENTNSPNTINTKSVTSRLPVTVQTARRSSLRQRHPPLRFNQ